jgi:hypothetical protein
VEAEDSKSLHSDCSEAGLEMERYAGAAETSHSFTQVPEGLVNRTTFADAPVGMSRLVPMAMTNDGGNLPSAPFDRTSTTISHVKHTSISRSKSRSEGMPRTQTMRSDKTKNSGYGGFPMPLQLLHTIAQKLAPDATKKLQRTVTQSHVESDKPPTALFTSFPLKVGRNSLFLNLTKEQKEELGGVEYRASKLLLKIVYCVSETYSSDADLAVHLFHTCTVIRHPRALLVGQRPLRRGIREPASTSRYSMVCHVQHLVVVHQLWIVALRHQYDSVH